jgi:7 transmembrane receptor (rhodopsin family)
MSENTTIWLDDSDSLDDFTNSSLINISTIDHHVPRNTSPNLPYTIMESIVAILAVIGNLLVIIVFFRERRLRRRTNYYIVSLALADFLVGLIGIPFAIMVNTTQTAY